MIIKLLIIIKNVFRSFTTALYALFALLLFNSIISANGLEPFLQYGLWSNLVWKIYFPIMVIVNSYIEIKGTKYKGGEKQ